MGMSKDFKIAIQAGATQIRIGSMLFGAGWGLVGLCPGPAITSLALFNISSIAFVFWMFIGFYIASKFNV